MVHPMHPCLSKGYCSQRYHYPLYLVNKFDELFFSSIFQFYWCPRTTCKLFYVSALGHTLADQSHFLVEFTRCIFSKASKALAFSTLTFCSVSISSCLGLMYQSDQSNHSESAHLSINYTSVLVQPYFRFLLFPWLFRQNAKTFHDYILSLQMSFPHRLVYQ